MNSVIIIIRIRMSFIVYTYEEFVFVTEAPQCNRMTQIIKNKQVNRVWECVATAAMHSGNLGHGSYSRDWIICEYRCWYYLMFILFYLRSRWSG